MLRPILTIPALLVSDTSASELRFTTDQKFRTKCDIDHVIVTELNQH